MRLGEVANRCLKCLFGSSGADLPADGEWWWQQGASDPFVDADTYGEMQHLPGSGRGPLVNGRGRPLRILALHGRGSNNDITAIQLVSLELHDRCRVDALAAPIDDAPYSRYFSLLSERKFRRWWRGAASPDALEPALRGVLAFVDARGPYDGLYGFSQGSALVAALSTPGVARPRRPATHTTPEPRDYEHR